MLPSFWNKSITVMRGVEVAGRGDDKYWNFDAPAEHVVGGCFFTPVATGENNDFREGVSVNYVLRLPANVDVKSTDRIRLYVGSVDPEQPVFNIVGIVRDVPSATGSMDHKRCELEAWRG